MHLHRCRCFQEHVRMLLHSLRALRKAPGGAGSIWIYLEALVRATGVSGRFACGFCTELHFADMWIAWSICHLRPLDVVKGSFSEHWPLYLVLTLLLGNMLDVARYRPHGGKLHLLCQVWKVWSTSTKQNLRCDCHYMGNCHANRTSRLDRKRVIHLRSRRYLETNITSCPVYIYHTSDFSCRWLWCIPGNKHATSNRLTPNHGPVQISSSFTQQDSSWREHASWPSLISFWLVANSIFLSTSHFFLSSSSSPLHNSKSCLHKHLSAVRLDPNRAEQQALHPTCLRHLRTYSSNADTTWSTATQQLQPPKIWPRMLISKWYVIPEAAKIRSSIQSEVTNSIST